MKADLEKYDAATRTTLRASGCERCIGKYFAPCVLSNVGRIVLLLVYVAWTAIAIWATTKVEIFFDTQFFVSEEAIIFPWYEKSKIYFDNGAVQQTVFYVDSDGLDMSTTENQEKINALNNALETCDGCKENWHQEQSLRSWYIDYQEWTQILPAKCTQYTRVGDPVDTVPQEDFFPCLVEYLQTDKGKLGVDDLKLEGTKNEFGQYTAITAINGWRQ